MKKYSVLQVLPSLISGGVERGTTEIASALVKNNFNSYVASAGGPMMTSIYHKGSKHFILPLASKNPFVMYKNYKALVDIIKDYDIDIVHVRSRAPAWSAYFAARATGKKFVTTFHGIYNISGKLKKYYNSIMTKGDLVIAVSNFASEHIKANYEINSDKIKVIHRGVDLDFFDPEKVSQERIIQMAKRLHIQMDRPIILLPGRITRWKGHKFLLDALRLLEKDSFYCFIVGDDKGHITYRRELEALINSYGLDKDVALVTNVTDMPALYLLADLVLSTSIEPEAFGRIVIEAQSMGRLVVATNIGGACETIIDNKTGWLVDVGDVGALAAKIKELLFIDPEIRKKKCLDLRQYIADNFSEKSMCNKTIEVYNQLLSKCTLNKTIEDKLEIFGVESSETISAIK